MSWKKDLWLLGTLALAVGMGIHGVRTSGALAQTVAVLAAAVFVLLATRRIDMIVTLWLLDEGGAADGESQGAPPRADGEA